MNTNVLKRTVGFPSWEEKRETVLSKFILYSTRHYWSHGRICVFVNNSRKIVSPYCDNARGHSDTARRAVSVAAAQQPSRGMEGFALSCGLTYALLTGARRRASKFAYAMVRVVSELKVNLGLCKRLCLVKRSLQARFRQLTKEGMRYAREWDIYNWRDSAFSKVKGLLTLLQYTLTVPNIWPDHSFGVIDKFAYWGRKKLTSNR